MFIHDIAKILKWKVIEGSMFLWDCYGPNARSLDFTQDEYLNGWNASVIFDTDTLLVYEVSGHSGIFSLHTDNELPWRWINPDYREQSVAEHQSRGLHPTIAWDTKHYVEIDTHTKMLRILALTDE